MPASFPWWITPREWLAVFWPRPNSYFQRLRRIMAADNDNQPLPEETGQWGNNEDEVRGEINALRAEADAQKDRALRALAEVENVRKRLERERDEARTYSVTRFAREMLTVADNLSRALAALPPELRNNAGDAMKGVL